jgi:hypothetical protein
MASGIVARLNDSGRISPRSMGVKKRLLETMTSLDAIGFPRWIAHSKLEAGAYQNRSESPLFRNGVLLIKTLWLNPSLKTSVVIPTLLYLFRSCA